MSDKPQLQRDADGRVSVTIDLHIYMEDTDAGGIVYYVNYLKFMERARTDMFRALGVDRPAVFSEELMFVVHDIQAKYHRAAELGDQIQVSATIEKLGKASVYFAQQVNKIEPSAELGELLCESRIKIACVTRDTRKPVPMPADLFALISAEN